MKKAVLTSLILVALSWSLSAQSGEHKIIFQLASGDTIAHKALMKQLSNITSVSPDSRIEVLCHGPGLDMLVMGRTTVKSKIEGMKEKGIVFTACEFSMKERKVSKEEMMPDVGYVKAGIIHVVERQEQGWSYIKAGF
jgi:intracellular sulfur oxidation DsrE/DsrF family protein